MLIGSGSNSIQTTEAYDMEGEFDIDELYGKLTFKLPYLLPGQKNVTSSTVDITRLKKYDTVQLYYRDFPYTDANGRTVSEPAVPTLGQLKRVFYGFIKSIKLSKSKDSIDYEIEAHGSLGMADERPLSFERKEGELQNLIIGTASGNTINNADIGILQLAFGDQTNTIIPNVEFRDVNANTLFIKVDSAQNLKDVLSKIRENYAVIITQIGDGTMLVLTPFYLLSSKSDSYLSANGWSFVLGVNMFNLDYGDITDNVNSVAVLGFYPSWGVAIDPIMLQLNAGSGNPVTDKNYNFIVFENRNLQSDLDCQKVARQKLLEIERNFAVSFKTKFDPAMTVGQPFTLTDYDRFNNSSVWIIKKLQWTITKDDVSATITGYAHSLTTLPEQMVIDTAGLADINGLEAVKKADAALVTWTGNLK